MCFTACVLLRIYRSLALCVGLELSTRWTTHQNSDQELPPDVERPSLVPDALKTFSPLQLLVGRELERSQPQAVAQTYLLYLMCVSRTRQQKQTCLRPLLSSLLLQLRGSRLELDRGSYRSDQGRELIKILLVFTIISEVKLLAIWYISCTVNTLGLNKWISRLLKRLEVGPTDSLSWMHAVGVTTYTWDT